MHMIRPAALALCTLLSGAAAARADAPTPCGPRVTAAYSSLAEGNWRYLYLIELVAHRAMEVRVTLQLPQTAARWPNGAAINMHPGMTIRHPFAEGVLRHYSPAEMQAYTTLMCRDLG
ncbi:hypothetical protein [Sediminicoccus sp. BL-A-41-H5]|jgi:hypothetical protein|uniref:hypothetical protein n=1 Tax=Sediminicoccus sp. BL-A-41-H5 TaxID=3421106 RepID=UPI003D67625C